MFPHYGILRLFDENFSIIDWFNINEYLNPTFLVILGMSSSS